MNPRSPQWLDDIADACAFIAQIASNTDEAGLSGDRLLRQAIERNFEIIGEALRRLEHADPDTASRISDYRQIVGLRNRLIHGYDEIDYERVWQVIQQKLPVLRREVAGLLEEAEEAWQAEQRDREAGPS